MPIYEYECEACQLTFEAWKHQLMAESPAPCPLCERTCKRIMSKPAFKIKGFSERNGYSTYRDRPSGEEIKKG